MRIGRNPRWRWCRVGAVVFALCIAAIISGGSQSLPTQGTAPEPATAAAVAESATLPAGNFGEAYHLPPAKLAQAIALDRIRTSLHFGSEFWELAVLCILLATGTAARLAQWTASKTTRPWLQALLFSAMLATLLFLLIDLPAGAIGHAFSLQYGIAVERWISWLLDQAKLLGLSVSLEALAFLLLFGLMHWGWSRRRYWLWFWVASLPCMLLTVFLLPTLIEPLFDSFEPLTQSHPALVAQLEKVVARTGTEIPQERMFLMKASEKSNGLNAYVTGIGATKRIVVWDTTADRMPSDEILFTFGHESGHYVLNHIPKGLAVGAIGLLALFFLAARLAEWLVRRFGSSWKIAAVPSLPSLAVLLLAFTLLQTITEPASNWTSRYFEHEADVYGQEAVHGIVPDPAKTAVAAFNDLGEAYLDDPHPNPFVAFWTYDHPSIQSRANFAAQYDPWAPGSHPRFFPR